MPYGGVHEKMGTHNHVLQLGGNVFLEVMAINPDTEPPENPRWYGLDDPYIRRQIKAQPTLLTWVVNTKNIEKLLQQTTFEFGKATLLSRGNLSWYFGLPDDGRLLAGGMVPYVIEWQTDRHPSEYMVVYTSDYRWQDDAWMSKKSAEPPTRCSGQHLRSASWLLAAQSGRIQPFADLA